MNYLAHIYLSGESHEILAGNYMGDSIKGRNYEKFPEEIQRGILLHRHIDWFTDQHPKTHEAVEVCREYTGRYAPIAVDMLYDHFLASNWKEYSDVALEPYTLQKYEVLRGFLDVFPEETTMMFGYMSKQNWLLAYEHDEGIGRALAGLGRRIRHENNLQDGLKALQNHRVELDRIFKDFFPDLVDSTLNWLGS